LGKATHAEVEQQRAANRQASEPCDLTDHEAASLVRAIEEEDTVGCERFFAKAAGRGDLATLAKLVDTAGCTGGFVSLNSVQPPPDGAEPEAGANSANGVSAGAGASDWDAPTVAATAATAAAAATDVTTATGVTTTTDVTATTALEEAVRMKQWAADNNRLANGAAKAADDMHACGGFGPEVIRWKWDSADLNGTVASVHFARLLLGHDWGDVEAAPGTRSGGGGGGSDGTPSAVASEKQAAVTHSEPSAARLGAAASPPPVPAFVPVMSRPGGSLLKAVWGALMAGSNATVAMAGDGGGPGRVSALAAPALAAMAPAQFRISGVLGDKPELRPTSNGHVGPAPSQMGTHMGGGMFSGSRSRMGGSRSADSRSAGGAYGGSWMGRSRSADSRSAGGAYGGSRMGGSRMGMRSGGMSAAGIPQQRLPAARPVQVGGGAVAATGAALANGTFDKHPNELVNGKPVFYKVVDCGEASEPSVGQRLGTGTGTVEGVAERVCCWYNRDEVWMVGPERYKKANCEFGYAHPVAKGLPHPAVPGEPWTVSTTRGWMAMKPSEVTATVTVGVDVAAHVAWFKATWAMLAATTKLYFEGCVETARSDAQTQLMRATYALHILVLPCAFVKTQLVCATYALPMLVLLFASVKTQPMRATYALPMLVLPFPSI
jgi:hypothetical protein